MNNRNFLSGLIGVLVAIAIVNMIAVLVLIAKG
jgi:hypothetical protein